MFEFQANEPFLNLFLIKHLHIARILLFHEIFRDQHFVVLSVRLGLVLKESFSR